MLSGAGARRNQILASLHEMADCDGLPTLRRRVGARGAESERLGRPLHVVDGLLLATAQVHGLTMVTRNVDDFNLRGVPVYNLYE